jgi:hypothetical protein
MQPESTNNTNRRHGISSAPANQKPDDTKGNAPDEGKWEDWLDVERPIPPWPFQRPL